MALAEEAPVKIPSKRKRSSARDDSSSSGNGGLVPLRKQNPSAYLYGKLNATEFVQKLTGEGISGAKLEEVGPDSYIIDLVSFLNYLHPFILLQRFFLDFIIDGWCSPEIKITTLKEIFLG